MRKSKSHLIFWTGLLVTLIVSSLLYSFIPRHEYYGGDHLIYKPGNAHPEAFYNDQTVSNIYLLLRFTECAVIYWLVFGLLYFIAGKVKSVEIRRYYIWIHAVLAFFGFSLLIYFNRFIVRPEANSQNLDIFLKNEGSKSETLEMYQLVLLYDSMNIPTSIIGTLSCVMGIVIFVFGLIRGWNTSADIIYKP